MVHWLARTLRHLAMKFAGPPLFGHCGRRRRKEFGYHVAVSRRIFLAELLPAALAAAPALGRRRPVSGEIDVAIVGAGAAGIAAARRIRRGGTPFCPDRGSDQHGGRCVTDTTIFRVPFDRGAHRCTARISTRSRSSPRAAASTLPRAARTEAARRPPQRARRRDGGLSGGDVRASRAIQDTVRGKADITCAQALPKDLGDWRPRWNSCPAPSPAARSLDELSAMDFAQALERDAVGYCRQGFGALLTKLAGDLPVQFGTAAARVQSSRNAVEVETARGRITARALIVTVSTGVLAAEKIKFSPELPNASSTRLRSFRSGASITSRWS